MKCKKEILFSVRYILLIMFFVSAFVSKSQSYPVHITAQLIPPYSAYLPDYTNASFEKLRLIILFNDFTEAHYNIKLKFEIKGNGFTLSTKTFYSPAPITLYPGQPLMLSGTDLAPYLSSSNLDFSGISQSQYEQKMALPEGYYSICVKAYDYYNNSLIQVSNEACAQAWFTLSDPPFLNLPMCNSVLKPQTPQNILFQWTPMNLGSPNSATNTVYEFALWECKPDSNANPNQVVMSTLPVYSTTTEQTFINYGPLETPLNLYMKYIWRVRAKDNSGRDLFKNRGYSQICTFKYGNPANVLGNTLDLTLSAQAINHRSGQCDWNKQSAFTNYLLQVRKPGTPYWFDYPNISGTEKISNLEPATTYECRVRGEGNGITGSWSNVAEFTTLDAPRYSCNDQSSPYNVSPGNPLPFIKAVRGLIFESGQFEITTTNIESSGAAGWFKGRGHVKFFGKRIPVKWDNIFIDADSKHQQGIIDALSNGVDKWLDQWDVKKAEEDAVYTNGTIANVSVNGNQVCYTLQGNNTQLCAPVPGSVNVMVIRDGEGNQYNINLIPPPPKITGPTNYLNYSSDSLQANDSMKVMFKASVAQKYGFDEKQYAAFIDNYEAIKLRNGKNYFVPNKSIGESQEDEVIAEIMINQYQPDLLSFKTANGTLLAMNATNTENEVKVSGIPADAGSIYAWYNNKKMGKLNIYKLSGIAKKLILVPVNGASISLSADQLNQVYKQANVTWSVQTTAGFTFNLGNDGLEAADASLMSKYSAEMRSLRDAYIQQDSAYDKGACYLFVVPSFSNPDVKGYMVRGRSLGFIAADATPKEIAHELGHGAFAFEHTFPSIQKSQSNNLMDYAAGAQMVKEQWQQIQYGKVTGTWFDDEEDASFKKTDRVAVFYWLNKIKVAYRNSNQVIIPVNDGFTAGVENCYVGGTQYDFLYLGFRRTNSEINVNVVNNLTTVTIGPLPAINPTANIGCVVVGNQDLVFMVPRDRMNTLKYYIQNTQTFKNLILFVNGYRPIVNMNGDPTTYSAEYQDSRNDVEFGDSRGYWKGIDAQFMNRIGTRTAVYADGHHSVATSNHLTCMNYTKGNVAALAAQQLCTNFNSGAPICLDYSYLHTVPNVPGFLTRHSSGDIAAQDMLSKIEQGQIVFDKNTDTLDVVAHSMGYAYAVGMIKRLKNSGIRFGRLYILAPENACTGGCDWSWFREVWQYGTDERTVKPYNQDGVAPQCMALGLDRLPAGTRGGRVYIPPDWPGQGYLGSHTVANYGWVFSELRENDPRGGYVKPRR
jgi:hypothetical protein